MKRVLLVALVLVVLVLPTAGSSADLSTMDLWQWIVLFWIACSGGRWW